MERSLHIYEIRFSARIVWIWKGYGTIDFLAENRHFVWAEIAKEHGKHVKHAYKLYVYYILHTFYFMIRFLLWRIHWIQNIFQTRDDNLVHGTLQMHRETGKANDIWIVSHANWHVDSGFTCFFVKIPITWVMDWI